jgi:hypothetical protein
MVACIATQLIFSLIVMHCTTARGGRGVGISDAVWQGHGVLFPIILISPQSGGRLSVGCPADSAAGALLFLLPSVVLRWHSKWAGHVHPPARLNLNFLLTEVLALRNQKRIIVL